MSTVAAPPATCQRFVPPPAPPQARRRQIFGRTLRHLPAGLWLIVDWALVALVTYLCYETALFGSHGLDWAVAPWLSGLVFCACIACAGLIFGLYETQVLLARSRIVVRMLLTVALGSALAYAIIFVLLYSISSRWHGLWIALALLGVAMPLRLAAHSIISGARLNVLCVGTTASVRKIVSLLYNGHRGHYLITGHVLVPRDHHDPATHSRFIPSAGVESDRYFGYLCPCVGTIDEIADVVRAHQVDQVVVDPDLATNARVGEGILACLEQGCRVTDQPTFTEKLYGEVPADAIGTQWFLMADVASSGGHDAVKRCIDLVTAGIGLLLTGPLWPLIALVIKLDSPGPALFTQQRVGRHGRPFTILKFRTMRQDAERDGAQWAQAGDTRVTRLGRFLRKTRIDELPQFWNILRGDMSIVGPRPERPEFVDQLRRQVPHYKQRHLIKPGLTGWAQINYRYGASVEDAHRKLCYDLYYLKYRSIELDCAILIRTLGTFILGSR